MKMRKLPRNPDCFVCGRNNEAGTDVTWIDTGEEIIGEYWGKEKHNSYKGIIHGGILSALLDESIGWAVAVKERRMLVTGTLNMTFKIPVPVGKKITVKGFCSNDQSVDKKYRTGTGMIVDDDGTVYVTAEGKFFFIPEEFESHAATQMEFPDDVTKKLEYKDLWD
jgi:acyl-coenzyme A thioesterase PaaI-like protein